MKARSSAQILSKIGCPFLSLHKGDGYWYFVYDAIDVYETKSVMTMRLNDLDLDMWVADGKELQKIGDAARRELSRQNLRQSLAEGKK